jgi:hypothetical protein
MAGSFSKTIALPSDDFNALDREIAEASKLSSFPSKCIGTVEPRGTALIDGREWKILVFRSPTMAASFLTA